jgi:hypothetical protein
MSTSDDVGYTLRDAYNLLKLHPVKNRGFIDRYFVERESKAGSSLATEISLQDEPAKFVFSGHRGSGKTTELYHASHILRKEHFSVVFISALKDAALSDLYYTDILILLIRKGNNLIADKKTAKKLETNTVMLAIFVELGDMLVAGLVLILARSAIASEHNKGQHGFEQSGGQSHGGGPCEGCA